MLCKTLIKMLIYTSESKDSKSQMPTQRLLTSKIELRYRSERPGSSSAPEDLVTQVRMEVYAQGT